MECKSTQTTTLRSESRIASSWFSGGNSNHVCNIFTPPPTNQRPPARHQHHIRKCLPVVMHIHYCSLNEVIIDQLRGRIHSTLIVSIYLYNLITFFFTYIRQAFLLQPFQIDTRLVPVNWSCNKKVSPRWRGMMMCNMWESRMLRGKNSMKIWSRYRAGWQAFRIASKLMFDTCLIGSTVSCMKLTSMCFFYRNLLSKVKQNWNEFGIPHL